MRLFRASNNKEKPRRRKKRTPTVALASDKYKERRGIVKPNSVGEGSFLCLSMTRILNVLFYPRDCKWEE